MNNCEKYEQLLKDNELYITQRYGALNWEIKEFDGVMPNQNDRAVFIVPNFSLDEIPKLIKDYVARPVKYS